jgi:hypothetical protein
LSITSIDVGVLRNRKDLELIPWEIISAFGKQELGIDPLLIESIDIAAAMPSPKGPEFGGVIRTKKPVDIKDLSENIFSETVESPKVKGLFSRNVLQAPIKVAQAEAQVILFGTEGTLRRMLGKPSKETKSINLMKASKYPIRSVTSMATIRPILEGALADVEDQVPPDLLQDIQVVLEEMDYFVSGNDMLGLDSLIEMKLIAKDSESASKLAGSLSRLRTNGMVFAEQAIKNAIDQDGQMSPELKTACLDYMARAKAFINQAELWSVNGEEVALKGSYSYSIPTIGVMTGLLLPAVQAAREAARRMQSSNNLKQLMLSIHNYESAYKRIPTRATKSKDGKPLLSWRVAMLPYLEEVALYNEFHQNEPWDSPHNIKLLERMPKTFSHPNARLQPGYTVYVAPYRQDTVWNQEKPRFGFISDGMSNTIALVEVKDEHAVPWTKPDDLELDDLENYSFLRQPKFEAGFFDGSVHSMSSSTDQSILEALVTSAGGEVVNLP